MKKRVAAGILGGVILTMLGIGVALANDPPHDASNGIQCVNCHTAQGITGADSYVNVCLSCHRLGMPRGGRLPFAPSDQANPFGNLTTTFAGTAYQISHSWSGPDNVPAAGAQAPSSPELNASKATGMLACTRCHDPHTQANPPYLRLPNDRDQLCLDCHRARNVQDHRLGSHPINFNYTSATSKAKLYPALYNNPPLNANPANPTSAIQFKGGTLLCSSCHGVHFADSNSATFDGFSSYRTLTPSAGYLLRTDLKGATAASLNICTNCHVKKNHNGKNQNVQCVDCHGAHVDVGDGSAPNTFLIRRYMNVSTAAGAVRGAKVIFQGYTQPVGNYKDANGTGVCQGCHQVPTGPNYPPEHTLATATAATCNPCHSHANPAGAFTFSTAGCSACHGYPPRANHAGGPDGYAANYANSPAFKDESLTPHVSHAGGAPGNYACGQCHQGNSHATGTFQDVFVDTTGLLAGSAASYSAAGATCNSVYCHSNGAPRNGSTVYKPVTWTNGRGTIVGSAGECSACHDARPTTNAHGKHLTRGYACATCHAATVSSDTAILDPTQHADGVKTVSFASTQPLTASLAWIQGSATCLGGKCHSDGRGGAPATVPNWLDPTTGACGSCHAQAPATLSHPTHFNGVYGPQLGSAVNACQSCHVYTTDTAATHVNGTVDVVSAAGSACALCHPGTIPTWGSGRLACTSCHAATPSQLPNGVQAPYFASFAGAGHGQFAASSACTACHDQNAPHIAGTLGVNTRLLLTNDNNLCASCHNDPTKVTTVARQNMVSHVTVKGGAATSDCKSCHDVHGSVNLHMIKTTINGVAVSFTNISSGFVQTQAPYQGLCQVCHTQTNHWRSGNAPDGHPTKFCLNCHNHKASAAFRPSTACDSCHGYPPVPAGFTGTSGNYSSARTEDYPGGGGAHLFHLKPGIRPADGWVNCTGCHGNGSLSPATHTMVLPVTPSKITIDPADRFRFNPGLPLGAGSYSGQLLDNGANTTGSCNNVSCHFKPSKRWSTVR
ncbi:cytochrome c [Geomonas sp. Red276]